MAGENRTKTLRKGRIMGTPWGREDRENMGGKTLGKGTGKEEGTCGERQGEEKG